MPGFDIGDDPGSGVGGSAGVIASSDPWATNITTLVANGSYGPGTAAAVLVGLMSAMRPTVQAPNVLLNAFTIDQGATAPAIEFPTLFDANGSPILIASATLEAATQFNMAPLALSGSVLVNGAGTCTYNWGANDTSIPGSYVYQLKIVDETGLIYKFPEDGTYGKLTILAQVGT